MSETFNGLIKAMERKDTLSGWDVLVSYDEIQLNSLLAQRAASHGFDTTMNWSVEDEGDEWDPPRTYTFDLRLLTPTMSFIDTSNRINLTAGIAGTYARDDKSGKKDLPSGLTCVISTSLVSLSGEWHDNGFAPSDGSEPKGHNWVNVLDPKVGMVQGVCLDLRNCSVELKDSDVGAKLSAMIEKFLTQHFTQAVGLRFGLAALGNNYEPNVQDSQVLQPTHFCFTVMPGVLMMWVALKGGEAGGQLPSGQTTLVFAPNASAISPIPKDRSASIIFNQATISNLFLKRSLQSSQAIDGSQSITSLLGKGEAGARLDVTYASKIKVVDKIHKQSLEDGTKDLDGVTINLNEAIAHFAMDGARPTNSHAPITISWTSNQKALNWTRKPTDFGTPGGHTQRGTCHMTFKFNGQGQWVGSYDSSHPNLLGFTFSFPSSFTVEVVAENPTFWESFSKGMTGAIPSEWQSLTVPAPTMNLSLKPLDYFLTTNLLLPGQHVFQADWPVARSDEAGTGLAVPRDMILTGHVAQNKTASAARALAVHHFLAAHSGDTQHLVSQHDLHELSSTPTTSRTPNLDDWKEAILSYPENSILGDYIAMLGSDDALPDPPIAELLNKHGFGNLFGSDFLNLWGTNWNEITKTKAFPEDIPRRYPEVASIDLRVYSGYYLVTEPAHYKGEQFMIHPTERGVIQMGRAKITSQQTYDTTAKKVVVSWRDGIGRTFSASFSVIWNAEQELMGMYCQGTVFNAPSNTEPFCAYLKEYMVYSAPELAELSEFDTSGADTISIMEENSWQIPTLITSLLIAGFTFMFMAYSNNIASRSLEFSKSKQRNKENYQALQKILIHKLADDISKDPQFRNITNEILDRARDAVVKSMQEAWTKLVMNDPNWEHLIDNDPTELEERKEKVREIGRETLWERTRVLLEREARRIAQDKVSTLGKVFQVCSPKDRQVVAERSGNDCVLTINNKVESNGVLDNLAEESLNNVAAQSKASQGEIAAEEARQAQDARERAEAKRNKANQEIVDINRQLMKNKDSKRELERELREKIEESERAAREVEEAEGQEKEAREREREAERKRAEHERKSEKARNEASRHIVIE